MNKFNARFVAPKAEGQEAELLIYGDIGESWYEEESTSARKVVDWLAGLPEGTPVRVRINSYGGSVSDGLAIFSALRAHKGVVTTQVDGVAMSSASLIYMGGSSRVMSEVGSILVHAPWTYAAGNAVELRQEAELLDGFAAAMANAYAVGVDVDTARAWLADGKDHFFTAQQAIDNGLAHETMGALPLAASYAKNRFTTKLPPGTRGYLPQTGEIEMKERPAAEVLAEERNRVAGIQRVAAEYGSDPTAVAEAVEAGSTPEAFELLAARAQVKALKEKKPVPEKPTAGAFRPTSSESEPGRIEAPLSRNRKLRAFVSPQEALVVGNFARGVLAGHRGAQDWLFQNRGIDIRGASLSSLGTAGILIPAELENAVVDLREEYGVLRAAARVPTMASDTLSRPVKKSGLTAAPIGESATMTEQELANMWGSSNLVARKWGVLVRYPSELSEDSIIDLAEDLAEDMGMAFSEAEDSAGFAGDGTSTYHGILGFLNKIILAAHAGSVVEATGNTFASVTITDIAKLIAMVPKRFRRNAAFIGSRVGIQMTLGRLKMAAGGNTMQSLEAADMERFLRYPIIETETFPSVLTTLADEVMIAFGDIRSACDLGNRRGIRLVESRERFIETDELAMQATERFDINWHSLGTATAPGPVAALLGLTAG